MKYYAKSFLTKTLSLVASIIAAACLALLINWLVNKIDIKNPNSLKEETNKTYVLPSTEYCTKQPLKKVAF